MKSRKVVWSGLLTSAVVFSTLSSARAADEVPFIASAYGSAQKDPKTSPMSATVSMTTLNESAPKVIVAQGPLKMEGDLLGARLPMSFDDDAKVAPGKHALMFNISKTGRIGLQWLLDDKPREGVSMQAFDTTIANVGLSELALSQRLDWNGAPRLVTIILKKSLLQSGILAMGRTNVNIQTSQTVKMADKKAGNTRGGIKITGPIVVGPATTRKDKEKKADPPPPTPMAGRNVKVTARFVITNSEDGFLATFPPKGDNRVELTPLMVFLGNVMAFDLVYKDSKGKAHMTDYSGEAGKEFAANPRDVAIRYDDPEAKFFPVSGSIYDYDSGSGKDLLWTANTRIDLLDIMNSGREFVIKGDGKSESGDLYIRVTDQGEFR